MANKNVKRGTIVDRVRVTNGAHTYPIVNKVGSKWEYENENHEEGAEVKFKIVHKYVGIRDNGRIRNELVAEII